jgi:hypothetical protein
MVSAIIKGTPQQCLAALNSSSSSSNSILGPATAVEVLAQSADGSSTVSVLACVLALCACLCCYSLHLAGSSSTRLLGKCMG